MKFFYIYSKSRFEIIGKSWNEAFSSFLLILLSLIDVKILTAKQTESVLKTSKLKKKRNTHGWFRSRRGLLRTLDLALADFESRQLLPFDINRMFIAIKINPYSSPSGLFLKSSVIFN